MLSNRSALAENGLAILIRHFTLDPPTNKDAERALITMTSINKRLNKCVRESIPSPRKIPLRWKLEAFAERQRDDDCDLAGVSLDENIITCNGLEEPAIDYVSQFLDAVRTRETFIEEVKWMGEEAGNHNPLDYWKNHLLNYLHLHIPAHGHLLRHIRYVVDVALWWTEHYNTLGGDGDDSDAPPEPGVPWQGMHGYAPELEGVIANFKEDLKRKSEEEWECMVDAVSIYLDELLEAF